MASLSLEMDKVPYALISVLYANIMGNYAFDLERKNLTMMHIEPVNKSKIAYLKPEDSEKNS